jgi:hypothetical protein
MPVPGYYWDAAAIASLPSPVDTWSAGGSRTSQPVACGAALTAVQGSSSVDACGEWHACCLLTLSCVAHRKICCAGASSAMAA